MNGLVAPFHSPSRCSGKYRIGVSSRSIISLTLVSSTSDSIFLLNGAVNVVLFCTIRRVIPVREVAAALFTGKIFRTQEKPSAETIWCIDSMETGEECISADLSLPTSDDHFVLRQPKFEIVTSPSGVLHAHPVPSLTTQLAPMKRTEDVVHADSSQRPDPKTGLISRPLTREPSICSDGGEGHDRSSSFSQSSVRRLPPLPSSPRSAALPSAIKKQETPPPPYLPTTAYSRQCSVSSSPLPHTHSSSLDSVVSDISGSTLFGSTDRDGPKNYDFPSQK